MKQSILIFLLFTLQLMAAGNTRFVTVTGAGLLNGSSWDHAYPGTSLQLAIDLSAPGDEVWVSCGTFFTTTSSNRSLAFHMRNGVAVYGSFQGTETSLAQRIFSCGPCSILSGEIGRPGFADNSYHVISNNGLDFYLLALWRKQVGQSGVQSYDYTDTLPAGGYYQYRIKSVQSDGSSLQSKQVAVHWRKNIPDFNFQVDQSAKRVKIQTDQPVLSLCLIDLSGRVLTTVYQKELDYHHLRSGVYCLRLQTADKVHSTLLWLE